MKPRIRVKDGKFGVVRLADRSDSAFHWSPIDALESAKAFCETNSSVNKCYIILVTHEHGRHGEDDTVQHDSYISALNDLESIGVLQKEIVRRS